MAADSGAAFVLQPGKNKTARPGEIADDRALWDGDALLAFCSVGICVSTRRRETWQLARGSRMIAAAQLLASGQSPSGRRA